MPEGGAAPAARQELAKDRDDLGQEIANVRENLDEAIRGTRAELRRRLGPLSATLIGGSAISLPIAPDRIAEMRSRRRAFAPSWAVRVISKAGSARPAESPVMETPRLLSKGLGILGQRSKKIFPRRA